jgi:hypothetical protein
VAPVALALAVRLFVLVSAVVRIRHAPARQECARRLAQERAQVLLPRRLPAVPWDVPRDRDSDMYHVA